MNTKTKSIVVLTSICLIVASLLALVNSFTSKIIADNERKASLQACFDVMEGASDFKELDKATYQNLPATITTMYEETTGKGYVFKITTRGYADGFVIICGINPDGKVTNAKVISSNETPTLGGQLSNESYTNQYIGKDENLEGITSISGVTVSCTAFKGAIKDAFTAFKVLKGSFVKVDPKDEVIPGAEGFEKLDLTLYPTLDAKIKELIVNDNGKPTKGKVNEIYKETSGKGYIFVIENTAYEDGHIIMCGIDMEGKIINVKTIASNETPGLGTLTEEKNYTDQYIGKDENLEGITGITGATYSSNGYKQSVKIAFVAYDIVKEVASDEK